MPPSLGQPDPPPGREEGGVTVRNGREDMSGKQRGCEEWEGGVRVHVRSGREDTNGKGKERM